MRKNSGKKYMTKLAGVALLAALAVGIGSTNALIQHSLSWKNKIKTPTTMVSIQEHTKHEQTSWNKTKEVSFKNEGNSDVFVRVAYAEDWENGESGKEKILSNIGENGPIAEKKGFKLPGEKWQDGKDGWYYYKYILPVGGETENILQSVDFSNLSGAGNDFQEYKEADYRLHFQVEAVQASDELKVSQDATEEVFGMSISPTIDGKPVDDSNSWKKGKEEAVITWSRTGGSD